MTNFTKWFIFNAVLITALVLAAYKGVLQVMITSDVSYITPFILLVLLIINGLCGKLAYNLDKKKINKTTLSQKLNVVKFTSDKFTLFGLAGTLIGMSLMLYNTLGSSQDIQSIINQLKVGASTAFYTTLIGIFASFCTEMQIFLLEGKRSE